MAVACLSDGELQRFVAGRASVAEQSALAAHLDQCDACRQRLDAFGRDRPDVAALPAKSETNRDCVTPTAAALDRTTAFGISNPSTLPTNAPKGEGDRHGKAAPTPNWVASDTPPTNRTSAEPDAPTLCAPHPILVPVPIVDLRAQPEAVRAPPAACGRYEIRRALGVGGFGAVYLGHDSELDRPVAVKVLHAGAVPADNQRCLQEARRLARLRHAGIVAVHDVGVQDGQLYIVSDFIDGPDLGGWLQANRPTWPEAARLTAAVADALAHAHERLIVHRDVKPANILLAPEGPVLVDFGLALDEAHAGGREKGVLAGTPWYMSPEQAAGTAHRIDGRTDIYSLGVVLFELLTGRLPFPARELSELLRQLREDEPQPPRQLVRDIPPELERICLKAMAKREQDRYSTGADFAAELRRVLPASHEPSITRTAVHAPSSATMVAGQRDSSRSEAATPPSSVQRRTRDAERRQVTILACGCSVFESDAYLNLDVEDQARVLRVIQAAWTQRTTKLDGAIVQCNEQGLLACFGYPVAYEDSAQRAARAGLDLLDDLKPVAEQLRREHNLDLGPWAGIHTGPAFVETKDDSVSLVGEVRNVATRMDTVATSGQVLCSDATYRLIRDRFPCESVGRRKIKGVAHPIELFQVQGMAPSRSRIEAVGAAELTPLTGRDNEVRLLQDRWEQVQEGNSQVVLLVGEAGLGKSRLVHTLKQHALGSTVEGSVHAPVIEWRCAPQFQNTGLYPAIDFYERALEFGREEAPAARLDRLLERLKEYGLARPETVPLWAALLSLPAPAAYPALGYSPARQRDETFRAMLEWLHVRAARNPVLLVVEDLHWADASTVEFLELFLAEGQQDAILTLLTCRPEFQPPWRPIEHQTHLALTRLTRRQVAELIQNKAGSSVPDAVIAQVYERAGGVPLFVEEFTQMVREAGGLEVAAPGDAPATILPAREIPATLQDLMMARLDRMGDARELAELAAVLGREFSHELLAAVAMADARALQGQLAALAEADILHRKGQAPRCTYLFKHALLEDALYNALVKDKRQQLHRRIAEVLAVRFPQTAETQPELLGYHFTEANQTEQAVTHWLKAGQRSHERSADREAISHLTKGLKLLRTLPETGDRDGRELHLLATLGPAYIAVRGYAAPEVGPILQRARELCERISNPQQLFGNLLGTWEWHLVRGDLSRCAALIADGTALAERMNDPGMLMEALFMPGVTAFYQGRFVESRAYHERALAEYEEREQTKAWAAHTGHNASVTHRCYLALNRWLLGFADQAIQLNRETCALAREIGHPFTIEHAVDFSACLSHYCRLGGAVQAAAEEELAIATDQGFQLWHALGTLHKGVGILLQGSPEAALPIMLKGFSAFRATGAGVRVHYYLGILADAYTQLGRHAEARQALDEGLAIAVKSDDRFFEAELHRLKGELLLIAPGDAVAAEACFRQAIEIARSQYSRAWELRAAMSLARLRQRQGRGDEGRAELAAVYGTFTEGFTTPDLIDATALLQRLSTA